MSLIKVLDGIVELGSGKKYREENGVLVEVVEKKPRYMKVKGGKIRFFNGVRCELSSCDGIWKDEQILTSCDGIWKDEQILMYRPNVVYPYKCVDINNEYCRIPEFTPENPPPIDTLVKVAGAWGMFEIRHFSHFEGNRIVCFNNGKTSKTTRDTEPWPNWDFVDFPESDFEWIEE